MHVLLDKATFLEFSIRVKRHLMLYEQAREVLSINSRVPAAPGIIDRANVHFAGRISTNRISTA